MGATESTLSVESEKERLRRKPTKAKNKTRRKEYEIMQTNDRQHACSFCDKRFKNSSHLRDHEMIHTNTKPFRCKLCAKRFRQRQHLTFHHKRNHTNERPYQCSICEKAFADNSSLTKHMKFHPGETRTPYACPVCEKRFSLRKDMLSHKERKHFKVISKGFSLQKYLLDPKLQPKVVLKKLHSGPTNEQ